MAPVRWTRAHTRTRTWLALAVMALGLLPASQALAIRAVTWNVYAYPSVQLSTRQPHFRTIVDSLHADIIVAQELNSQAGSDSFLTNVLNVVEPGEWTGQWRFLGGPAEGGSIFWKPAVVSVANVSAVANTGGPRDFLVGLVTPVGYVSSAAKFFVYSLHLKAGSSGSDLTTRNAEGIALRNILNTVPPLVSGGNFIVGGDYNMDNANEGGYQRLTESTTDDDGRCKDPLTTTFFWSTQWGNNSGFALGHTQSACLAGCISSTGGMDDRFDLWLTSFSMQDGEGLDYRTADFSEEAYPWIFGNDGTKFNLDINAGGSNNSVGLAVANALRATSDHVPVIITIQVPAKVSAASQIDFGDAIVGGTAEMDLDVTNIATEPGDDLDYSFTDAGDFTAPGGSFSTNPGDTTAHAIAMDTGTLGAKTGSVTIDSDDPDSLSKDVLLSGNVLDHASASLDSLVSLLSDSLNFGEHETGMFPDSFVRIHNLGYDGSQAELSIDDAVITGGDGRFTLIGGFNPSQIGGVGTMLDIAFDDAGATQDSLYTATLTISSSDEPLPGATAQPDLVVELTAMPSSGTVSVGPGEPTALRFYPPRPNPLTGGTRFAFELPKSAPVELGVYDLSGRRVTSLASGEVGAGRHEIFWNAVDARGARVSAGVYFARFETPGLSRTQRLVVLP